MKRYALFLGSEFYPSGGFYDLDGTTDDREEAIRRAVAHCEDRYHWAHVIDLHTGAFVGEWGS